MTKRFELRLCSNGTYYVYENGTLTDVDFDKFNKESAYALIDKVNALYEEKEQLKMFLKALNEELSLANRDCDILEEENEQLRKENDMFSCELSVSANKEISRNCRILELEEENKQYKSLFFELVETALTDKNCRELYCKGILDIFNKANSLNQAREMIKEHLE